MVSRPRPFHDWRTISSVVVVAALLAVVLYSRPTPSIATYVSSSGTHQVDLVGRADRPAFPVVTHTVYATVLVHAAPTVTAWPLHVADHMDSTFRETYGQPTWLSDTVLLVPRRSPNAAPVRDTLHVTNTSTKRLALLTLHADEITLVVDMAPSAQVAFPFLARARTPDVAEYRVEGQWADGTRLPAGRGMLHAPAASSSPRVYALQVADTGITVSDIPSPSAGQ